MKLRSTFQLMFGLAATAANCSCTNRAASLSNATTRLEPMAVITTFSDRLNEGDVGGARALIANFPRFPETELDLDRSAKRHQHGARLEPISFKAADDTAVVVAQEFGPTEAFDEVSRIEAGTPVALRRPDLDPAYMIRQNGEWKLLPELTEYDERYFDFTTVQLQRFAELEKWYESEEKRLVAEMKKARQEERKKSQ